MDEIRCAIIGIGPNDAGKGGCNSIAYAHAWAMRNTAGCVLAAGCARSQANRDGFAREFPGVPTYADYREMLARERPALVSICAWPRDREAMVELPHIADECPLDAMATQPAG